MKITNYTNGFDMYSLELSADENSVYISGDGRVEILDITTKIEPALLGRVDASVELSKISLSTDETEAYLSTWNRKYFTLGVSDLENPILSDSLDFDGDVYHSNASSNANKIFVTSAEYGISLVDITDINEPVIESSISTIGDGQSTALTTDGQLAYVADGNSGLYIIDVSDPKASKLVSHYAASKSTVEVQLSSDNKTAFVSSHEGIHILNVSNPRMPEFISSIGSWAVSSAVSSDGNTLYYSDANEVQVYDISNLSSPTHIKQINVQFGAAKLSLSADDETLFVTTRRGGIHMNMTGVFSYKVSDGSIISTIETVNPYTQSVFIGDIAYLSDGNQGIRIFNVSNPASMTELGKLSLNGEETTSIGVSPDGNTAYLTTKWTDRIHIVDISDSSAPSMIALFEGNSEYTRSVTVSADNNTAYVSDGNGGLLLLDVTDKTAPIRH